MLDNLGNLERTHNCGELRKEDLNKSVVLMGWVNKIRNLGGVIFIDLRDFYGKTQIVVNPENEKLFSKAELLGNEYVIGVKGKVSLRPEGMKNPNMSTGDIEIIAEDLLIFNTSETPPFDISSESVNAGEELRLKYRYLDLRNERMKKNIKLRMGIIKSTRKYLEENNFNELETPMLIKSTPEGARDYLVPARLYPGKFYALPQSPQLYKQLYMVSGFDRYFQFARCFRDEDSRGDRQPEHVQIDIEMSFATEEKIYSLIEGLMKRIFKENLNIDLPTPFLRLKYDEAIERYGTDKPDIRFGLELKDATEIVKNSEFKVFASTVENNGKVKFINVKGGAKYSRKEIESFENLVKHLDAKGLAWMKYNGGLFHGGISKFLNEKELNDIKNLGDVDENDILFFVADKPQIVAKALSGLRNEIGKLEKLYNPSEFAFLWVNEFPLFEYNEEEGRWEPAHHMFTMPQEKYLDSLEENPGAVKGQLYDLVCNGVELASGSIRIHRRDIQERIFNIIGMDGESAKDKFGFLLKAFEYGAPPHGGIAPGLDRLTMILAGENTIRDVIAFPKTLKGLSLVDDSPSEVSEKQLKELKIKIEKE